LDQKLGKLLGVVLVAALTGFVAAFSINVTGARAVPDRAAFLACAARVQGSSPHPLTLREANVCGAGLTQVPRDQLATVAATTGLPSIYLVTFGNRAILEGASSGASASTAVGSVTLMSCYNTWAYPYEWFNDVTDWGSMSSGGYGNHCNYANIPSNPTLSVSCVPGCAISKQVGRADSTWDLRNYGINSALAWGNVSFSFPFGTDSWACRGWVNTNGSVSPYTAYCY